MADDLATDAALLMDGVFAALGDFDRERDECLVLQGGLISGSVIVRNPPDRITDLFEAVRRGLDFLGYNTATARMTLHHRVAADTATFTTVLAPPFLLEGED